MSSASAEDLTPILVGQGQVTRRDVDPAQPSSPLDLMQEAARRAAEDARGGRRILAGADLVGVSGILGFPHPNPARLLAERIGARPALEIVTLLGGNSPQLLVNEVARRIREGRVRTALLAGAEAFRSRRLARRAGIEVDWKRPTTEGIPPAEPLGDTKSGSTELERAYGLFLAPPVYALFENALRAHGGLDLAAHQRRLGRLCSRMTEVAARNPHAWFPVRRTPEEITTVTRENRMIVFPYPKYMNAILEVDQGAALLVTSIAGARALGIPEERWVHVWGGGEAHEEPWFVSERPELHRSNGVARAAGAALAAAGLEAAGIDAFDLYSCFPCAVEIACDTLGIGDADPRPITLTGGLPYAGGPGNNYAMHSIAAMVEWLRAHPDAKGMVTAVGWYLSKHAAGVYAARPRASGPAPRPVPDGAAAPEPVPLLEKAEGRGVVETYTVVYDREGTPASGVVFGRLGAPVGPRFLAKLPDDPGLLEAFTRSEGVGRGGRVVHEDGANRFRPE